MVGESIQYQGVELRGHFKGTDDLSGCLVGRSVLTKAWLAGSAYLPLNYTSVYENQS